MEKDNLVSLSAADVNADNKADLVGSWTTPAGIWVRNTADNQWSQLHNLSATQIAMGDFNKNGKADLLGVWDVGIWLRLDDGTWSKILDKTDLKFIAAGDMTGDGYADVLGSWTFGTYYRNTADNSWVRLHISAEKVAAGDLDGDKTADLLGIWNGVAGTWVRLANGTWQKLNDEQAVWFTAGKMR